MKAVLLRGVSGSGKSTLAARFENAVVCSADDYFMDGPKYRFDPSKLGEAHAQCLLRFLEAVQAGKDVLVDNTNTTAHELAPYVAIAQAYGYEVEIRLIYCEPSAAWARSKHGAPLDVVLRQHHDLMAPLPGHFPRQRCDVAVQTMSEAFSAIFAPAR